MQLSKKHENLLDTILLEMKTQSKELSRTAMTKFVTSKVLHGFMKYNCLTFKTIKLYCDKHEIE